MRPEPNRNLWTRSLDTAVPTVRFLFWLGLVATPIAVLYFTYGQ